METGAVEEFVFHSIFKLIFPISGNGKEPHPVAKFLLK